MSLNKPSFRYPFTLPEDLDSGVRTALEFCFNGVTNHEQAFSQIKPQLDATAAAAKAASAASSISGVSSFNSETGDVIYFPTLGTVNDQLGNASYETQQSDNGAKIIVGDSSAVAVGLNAKMLAPWFAIIDNDSGAVATLTPDVGALLFGPNTIQPGGFGAIFFDGTNFYCGATGVMPRNTPAVTHQWLNSYNAATGAFGQTQPAFADISGNLTTGQLPTAGISGTFTLASLTVGGTQGSITVTNGLITAFTPST
jgi:hypothetical protein